MKQIIVLVAMVFLGIAIAGFVGNLGDSARGMSTNAVQGITDSGLTGSDYLTEIEGS